ncbi:hypothetical protein [Streptomyces sp. NPDC019890]|uniref:hypothetical protein n=1 Tax=Streptomyces sp. NPDC019890 TaxID=3365064 RepID=UPI00384ECC8D
MQLRPVAVEFVHGGSPRLPSGRPRDASRSRRASRGQWRELADRCGWCDLNEAFETADPLKLMRLFGISEKAAMHYVAAAYPERTAKLPP